MATFTVTAPDISCDHCKQTIERELRGMPGIQNVFVNVKDQQVTVEFDPGRVTEAAILHRLDEEGYPSQQS